jgi:hypothetical protein
VLVLSLPLEALIDTHPANMLTLSALERLSDHLGGMDEVRLVVAGGLLVAGALFLLARGRASSVAVAVAVAGFLAFASNSVFDDTRTLSRELSVHAAGPEPTWIDRRIGQGAHAAYVYVARPNEKDASTVLMQTGFWNRSLDEVVELEGNPVDVQPRHSVTVDEATGELGSAELSVRAAPYAVSPHEVVLVGERVAEVATLASPLVLYRLQPPFRIASRTEGVFPDGWTGGTASLTQYGGSGGMFEISLSREAMMHGAPAEVTLRLGTVKRRGRDTVMASVTQRRTVVIPRGVKRVVTLRAPASSFRLELSVTGTFRPAEFGSTDARELGVQVQFDAIGRPRS